MEELERVRRRVVEELVRREKDGWWELEGEKHPLVTAGALYLLRKNGLWRAGWEKTVQELKRYVPSADAESLRYILLLLSELGEDTEEIEKRLDKLFDSEKKLWRYHDGFDGDPLISSALLIAMWKAGKDFRVREALEGIKKNPRQSEKLSKLAGGERPVLTALYRALALALHGEIEEAKKIWETVKRGEIADRPPLYLLKKGVKKDELYPSLLALNVAYTLGDSITPFVEEIKGFRPEEWDDARLVTVGFYLELLKALITQRRNIKR